MSDVGSARIQTLRSAIAIMREDGNWNWDEYNFGLANGMIFAESVLSGVEPAFLQTPEVWGKDQEGAIIQTPPLPGPA